MRARNGRGNRTMSFNDLERHGHGSNQNFAETSGWKNLSCAIVVCI